MPGDLPLSQALVARLRLAVPGDVSREADCQTIIQQTLDQFGRIDALVNNGGIIEPIAPIAEANPQEWERNWAVNVLGPIMLAKMAMPHLRQMNGRIINITSGAAVNVVGGWGAYSAAKAALNHLTRIMASEEPAVTTIALRPGIVDTGMQAAIREKGKSRMAESNYNWLFGMYEQGRLLPPEMRARRSPAWLCMSPTNGAGKSFNGMKSACSNSFKPIYRKAPNNFWCETLA